jgi:DNA repair exonuclease SbcCD ATPase subunit
MPSASGTQEYRTWRIALIAGRVFNGVMPVRRLEDRIRKLESEIAALARETPDAQRLIQQLKADISEYFEREKNPQYAVERRADRL